MLTYFHKFLIFSCLFIFISSYERYYTVKIGEKEVTYKTTYLVEEDTTIEDDTITSNSLYDITILVVGGARLLINPKTIISKNVPQSNLRNLLQENTENFEESDDYKYGLTSTIVAVDPGTKIIINKAKIEVDCPFCNGIVALNGAKVQINNSTITTKKEHSKGIVILNDGFADFSGDTTLIKTEGNFSPCLEVDNKGEIEGSSIQFITQGEGSPLINTLGDGKLTIVEARGNAQNSQIMVVQGNNIITLYNSELSCFGKGVFNEERFNGDKNLNNGGIVLYKSDENNKDLVDVQFYNCVLSTNQDNENIPMFSCYNVEADITLDNTQTKNGKLFIKSDKTEDSNIYSKINLTINNKGFEGKMIAEPNTQIIVKIDKDLMPDNLECNGQVIFQ